MAQPTAPKKSNFGLSTLAIDNATSIIILTAMIFLFGTYSYVSIPKEAYPEIPFPQIFVNTVYFGNSAADIENLITRELEKEIAEVDDIKKVTSKSQQDYSIIIAEFQADVDLDVAERKLKDAVDRAKPELPSDLDRDPEVLKINLAELPIMTINMAGPFTNDELLNYAEYVEEKIEALGEISEVDIKGDRKREVQINVDLPRMESLQVSFGDIENAVRSENITMSGGEVVGNDFRRTIRIVGEFERVEQLEEMIVKSENQTPIYLRDIAEVKFGYKDLTSIARADGSPVISLDVIKEKGENLITAAENIREILDAAEADVLPDNMEVTVFNDLSVQTEMMVSNLQNSIISGIILVVLVLLFFLGIRNALFVGIAIPLSMLMGILIMSLIGYTLNMVVLFALILALGMLVDNAIVVVENIYRYMQNGYTGMEAAKQGTGEVAVPIIASTATTLAAFVPLAFWPGLMGQFMRYLPITLIIVLSSSLFVALVINPVLTSILMRVDEQAETKAVRRRKVRNHFIFVGVLILLGIVGQVSGTDWLRNLMIIATGVILLNFWVLRPLAFSFQNTVLPVIERFYDKFVRVALRKYNPLFFFGGSFALLIFALMLLGARSPKVELFPVADPQYVNAFIELPMGTDIEATDALMKRIEAAVLEVTRKYDDYVEAVLSQIGENTSDPNAGPEFGASPNKGRLTVSFIPSEDRIAVNNRLGQEVNTVQIMEEVREAVQGQYPGAKVVVQQDAQGPPQGKPINIEVSGDNVDTLALLSERMINFINRANVGGIEELTKDVKLGKPELTVNIDREAARRYGLSTFAIADAIRTAVFGKEISKYKDGEDDYPIQLRVAPEYRYDIDEILNQRVTFRSPATGQIVQVPISVVADVSFASTYSSINRKDEERSITIYSNVLENEGYNANEVVEEVKAVMADFPLPDGYSYVFTGQQEEQAENTAFLGGALLVAMFMILIIIVAQFNSILSPFIIMLTILFSTIGVFLGYVVTGMNIVIVMTGVGIISLAGIVVNNAIVLIDYTNLLLKNKRDEMGVDSNYELGHAAVKAAIIEGGSTRLRPVLLTAITTVLGLIPLAIGFNFDFTGLLNDFDPNIYVGGDNAAFWGVMAWTVIYGLVFATFLTLIIVPVMNWLTYRLVYLFKKGRTSRPDAPVLSEPLGEPRLG